MQVDFNFCIGEKVETIAKGSAGVVDVLAFKDEYKWCWVSINKSEGVGDWIREDNLRIKID